MKRTPARIHEMNAAARVSAAGDLRPILRLRNRDQFQSRHRLELSNDQNSVIFFIINEQGTNSTRQDCGVGPFERIWIPEAWS